MTALGQEFFDIRLPEGRPFQVIGLGLNAVDWVCGVPRYPEHNSKTRMESLHKMGGGQIATAAAMCARYGLKTRYVGRVGDDEMGRFSLEDLRKEQMDLSCVEVVPDTFSHFSLIIVDRATGERTILWDRDDRLEYQAHEVQRDWVVAGQVLHVDGHDQAACIQAARFAKEAGMLVSIDVDRVQPGVEELLECLDFAIPSINFVNQFAGSRDWRIGLRELARIVPGFVAATLGSAGVAALWNGEIVEIPSITVHSVDATGAGDVFHGAFLYSLFQGWSVERCLRFSNVAGALACTRLGARAGIPTLQEVLARMEA
jgi:sugar/nucleoside kinase (ribokinase family)